MSPAEITIPPRLARRPRDPRGLPIPYVVLVAPDGKPDFRVNDYTKWIKAVRLRLCSLCGEPLGGRRAFIGGPLSHANHLFTDAAMHRDCAEYALRVCPYLAIRQARHARKYAEIEGVQLVQNDAVSAEKPDRFALAITESHRLIPGPGGEPLIRAGDWIETTWYRDGAPLPDQQLSDELEVDSQGRTWEDYQAERDHAEEQAAMDATPGLRGRL